VLIPNSAPSSNESIPPNTTLVAPHGVKSRDDTHTKFCSNCHRFLFVLTAGIHYHIEALGKAAIHLKGFAHNVLFRTASSGEYPCIACRPCYARPHCITVRISSSRHYARLLAGIVPLENPSTLYSLSIRAGPGAGIQQPSTSAPVTPTPSSSVYERTRQPWSGEVTISGGCSAMNVSRKSTERASRRHWARPRQPERIHTGGGNATLNTENRSGNVC